ncbi:MAG TPA: DUF2339 domain-containing protein, partial [Chitinophagaceae bacterium]|nr:DUF2339 domain-containing protein [Chitinophagaceae bacterium]
EVDRVTEVPVKPETHLPEAAKAEIENKAWRPAKTLTREEEEPIPAGIPVTPPPVVVKEESPVMAGEEEEETTRTDWEKFIGENLANKIGIAVLVLGISFFVKFAIDKNWVNEGGRVIIGLISGAILIGFAHYIRNTYRSFSSVLVGGGLTVFYFSIGFAFHQYHLLSQPAAFIIMVIISAFAVLLSLFYNRIELAVLATIGGFITPFLVSTGQNNYVSLFTYLCILNSGLLVLSWFKRWKAINIIALFFTVIIYGSWLFRQVYLIDEPFPYLWAIFFATLFYLLSVAINIINNLKLKIPFGAFDFILLLFLNFLYYTAGMVILQYWNDGAYKGLFTASLGVFNLLLTSFFFRRKQVDRNFIHLLVGLSITYISLAAPVQLKGNYITLFWAAESVVLFWLYQRSRIVLLKAGSLLLLFPLLVSLFMDWSQVYGTGLAIIPLFVNKGFVTTFVTAVAFFVYYKLMQGEKDEPYIVNGPSNKAVRNGLLVAAILLAYATGAWEINYQFMSRLPGTSFHVVYRQVYNMLFILLVLYFFKRSPGFIPLKFLLTMGGFILYCFDLPSTSLISMEILATGDHKTHFIAHWAGSALLTWLLYDLVMFFRKQEAMVKDYGVPFAWIMAGCIIFLLSAEMYQIMMWTTYHNEENRVYWQNLYYKAGLSILWGLCSFDMMWLGMKYSFRTLRIISLSLFTVTLIKLFTYDIQNIPPGGKIAAFILLGLMLLIISFMYQRLKKIIIGGPGKIDPENL